MIFFNSVTLTYYTITDSQFMYKKMPLHRDSMTCKQSAAVLIMLKCGTALCDNINHVTNPLWRLCSPHVCQTLMSHGSWIGSSRD